jgi:glucan phosphoethanolaminetransferase (alkaline phosphatase superfamily)
MRRLNLPSKDACFAFLLVISSAILLNINLGYKTAKGIDFIFNALFFAFILSARRMVRRLAWVLVFISAVYSITANLYGKPSILVMSSLFQTNTTEALEFVKQVTCYQMALPVVTMLIFFYLSKDRKIKNNTISCVFLVLMAGVIFVRFDREVGVRLNMFNFFQRAYTSYYSYKENMADLNSSRGLPSNWKASSVLPNGKRKNLYIVIIGESMRSDYSSLYGYPVKNMPFLEREPGDYYSQYHAAAPNTFMALPRTLAKTNPDGNIEINNNIVTLAKALHMETYWLSNQGFLGKADTPISKISIYSDHLFLLKKGSYDDSNSDDSELITPYEKILNQKKENTLVVFHLMGSHANFCDRLTRNDMIIPHREKAISCYLSTYLKADKMIEKIYTLAEQKQYHFKIMYFSDHGLSKDESSGHLTLLHNASYKQNYNIPLLVLDSSAKSRTYHDKPISALNFISFYATFLDARIESPQPFHFDDNTIFNGGQYIDHRTLAEDPPVI